MRRIIFTVFLLAITISVRAQSNVVQVEYFLDADNGFGMNTVLDITSPDIDVIETILSDIPSSTSIGYHKLYFRTKDANNNWSQTIRKHIEIFAPVVENNIVMGEFFIDEDPGVGTAITFNINPQEEDIEQQFNAQIIEATTLGYHKLYGRVKDSYGNWSHTFRKNIEVYLNPETNIVEIEYFFNDDLEFGNNALVSVSVPEEDGTWEFDVPYPAGNYSFDDVLFIRVKDSNGNWSITTTLDEIESLGIKNNLYKTVHVSPNPFTDSINLESSKSVIFHKITVFDITGKVVYTSSDDLRILELGHLESGVYILSLSTEAEMATFKIVKQ